MSDDIEHAEVHGVQIVRMKRSYWEATLAERDRLRDLADEMENRIKDLIDENAADRLAAHTEVTKVEARLAEGIDELRHALDHVVDCDFVSCRECVTLAQATLERTTPAALDVSGITGGEGRADEESGTAADDTGVGGLPEGAAGDDLRLADPSAGAEGAEGRAVRPLPNDRRRELADAAGDGVGADHAGTADSHGDRGADQCPPRADDRPAPRAVDQAQVPAVMPCRTCGAPMIECIERWGPCCDRCQHGTGGAP